MIGFKLECAKISTFYNLLLEEEHNEHLYVLLLILSHEYQNTLVNRISPCTFIDEI